MNRSRIRRYVFVPVAAGLVILTAIITGSLHWYQSQHLKETVSARLTTVTKAFDNAVESDANVLDVGTEFGVKVGPDRGTEVQVYQGSVFTSVKPAGGRTNSPQRLLAGRAARRHARQHMG